APKAKAGRVIYGAAVAAAAAGIIFFQPTEFGIKVAILTSLTVLCALVPMIESLTRRPPADPAGRALSSERHPLGARVAVAARRPAVIAAVIIAVASPLDAAAFARNKQVVLIERGEVGHRNAQ
ncbi:MAG: hypothetical protein ABR598_07005, partial [Candidatus Dormibacteria bacterium]